MKTKGALLWKFNQPWSVQEIEIGDPCSMVTREPVSWSKSVKASTTSSPATMSPRRSSRPAARAGHAKPVNGTCATWGWVSCQGHRCRTARFGSRRAIGTSTRTRCSRRIRHTWSCTEPPSLRSIPRSRSRQQAGELRRDDGQGIGDQGGRRPAPGEDLAVVGLGGVGMSELQGAVNSGARSVFAVDPVEWKRDQALKFGASHAYPDIGAALAGIAELTAGRMAHKVIVTVGRINGADVETYLSATAKGGTCVLTRLPQFVGTFGGSAERLCW